jgi:hypothetical protein
MTEEPEETKETADLEETAEPKEPSYIQRVLEALQAENTVGESEYTKMLRADLGDKHMKKAATHRDLYELIGEAMDICTTLIAATNLRIDAVESAIRGESQ